MTAEFDRRQITKQLQDARETILQNLGLREQVHIEQTADEMDEVQASTARDLAIANLDRSARRLRRIDDALRRLETGEYGRCVNCEEEIGSKRLRAVPWAEFCLKCQEMADQGGLGDHGQGAVVLFVNAA